MRKFLFITFSFLVLMCTSCGNDTDNDLENTSIVDTWNTNIINGHDTHISFGGMEMTVNTQMYYEVEFQFSAEKFVTIRISPIKCIQRMEGQTKTLDLRDIGYIYVYGTYSVNGHKIIMNLDRNEYTNNDGFYEIEYKFVNSHTIKIREINSEYNGFYIVDDDVMLLPNNNADSNNYTYVNCDSQGYYLFSKK